MSSNADERTARANDEPMAHPRTRTVTWQDPLPTAGVGATMSGLDYLRAIADGKLPPPPIAELMGYTLDEVSEGEAVFGMKAGEHVYNPIGSVHGGVAATLLDSAMACAIHSKLPRGVGYTTLEIKVNYVRAMTRETGRVRAIGTLIHLGSRTGTAEGRLVDEAGKLYAHGTTTCLILGGRAA
jgi:uncharacterized protein (TIGR00369 family)